MLRCDDERQLVMFGLLASTTDYLLIATGWLSAVLPAWMVRGFPLPWIVIAAISPGERLKPDHLQGLVAAAITLLLFAAQPLTQARQRHTDQLAGLPPATSSTRSTTGQIALVRVP